MKRKHIKRKKKQKPANKVYEPDFDVTLRLNGKYRQEVIILNIFGGKPIRFLMQAKEERVVKLSAGCYIAVAAWKDTVIDGQLFYRYVSPVMFSLDHDLLIDLQQDLEQVEE